MPIKRFPPPGRFPSWDPRGWPEAQLDPPTGPIPRPLGLDDPDERTPLYAALYAVHGLGGRHALNPHREVVAMTGRHYDEDGNGVADAAEHAAELPHDDGHEPDPYTVIHPDQFDED